MVIYNLPGSFLSQYWWIPMSSSVQLNVNTLNDEHGTRNRTQLVKQGYHLNFCLLKQYLVLKYKHSLNIIGTFKNQKRRHEEGCDKLFHLFIISLTCTLIPFQLHMCKSIFTTFLISIFCVLSQGKVRIMVKSVSWNNLKMFSGD